MRTAIPEPARAALAADAAPPPPRRDDDDDNTADNTGADASDHELRCRYVRDGSHAAFARLVARHAAMVCAAARRQPRAGAVAAAQREDVAQAAFLLVARKAATIGPRASRWPVGCTTRRG